MVELVKSERKIGIFASVLGIIEGSVWLVLSFVCIIAYFWGNPKQPTNSLENLNYFISVRFLNAHYFNNETVVNSVVFTTFAFVYFFADIVWITISVLLIHAILVKVHRIFFVGTFWVIITSFICFIDFILVILISVDFNKKCSSSFDAQWVWEERVCNYAVLPVLVLIARGFVLWVVNVISVVYVAKIIVALRKMKKKEEQVLRETQIPRIESRLSQYRRSLRNGNRPYNGFNYPDRTLNEARPSPSRNNPQPVFRY